MAKKRIIGQVVSKSTDTVCVLHTYKARHKLYGKTIKKNKKYLCHDSGSSAEIGMNVEVEECVPVSKRKRFKVVRIIK